jgi:WD40 repeat protein
MIDGSIGLVEAESAGLKAYSTWKNCSEAIADLKFSPDGLYLAAGCKDGNIYLYIRNDDKKTFRRQAVCRGHMGAVTHLDFSANSQYLQSNGADHALLFWDVRGNQVKLASSLRDTTWATFTCVLGWPVQGVFQEGGSFDDVHSCCAVPAVGDTITGNADHCVKLYRYPAIHAGSLHQSYRGHASGVSCVRFSYNRRHAISLGEDDCTILLWAHTMEQEESSGDDEAGDISQSTGGLGEVIDSRKEIGDLGPRSLLQEAVNSNQPIEVIAQIARLEGPQRDGPRTVQPWKAGILEPSSWVNEMGGTDVDLELQWIHGYRSHDCRNNVRYSAAGSVVYTAATVGVVYSRSAGKQKFFLGAHADDIIGIAAHPSGQLFATGETGRQPSVIVWSSQDMRSMARIECSHLTGVPLLAFNSKGDLLASIGLDENHTLAVHDWAKNVTVLRTHTDKREVFCMCYLADSPSDFQPISSTIDREAASTNVIVTGGYKHVKFWWSNGQNISSQQGIFGKEERDIIMCVASGTPGKMG